jgi:hypothetical protein
LLTAVKAFEAGDELTAEDSSANLQGEKKTGIARRHPTGVIGRDAPGGDDAMDMGMSEQVLAPGMENAEDTDFGAQVLGVRRDFQQGGGGGGEQEMVKLTGVVLGQEVELVGDAEDHVKVRGIQ